MNAKWNIQIRKFLYGMLTLGMVLSLCLGTSGWSPAHARAATQLPTDTVVTPVPTVTDIPVATATEAPTGTLVPGEPASTPTPATTATEVPTEIPVSPEPINPQTIIPGNGMNAPTGAQRAPDGSWFMPGSIQKDRIPIEVQTMTALSTGGPDDFGYTWDDSGAVNWIDTTSGTNTGMTGNSYNKAIGPVSLPFSFKYYENTYTNLYIAASGYMSFTNNNGNWPWPRYRSLLQIHLIMLSRHIGPLSILGLVVEFITVPVVVLPIGISWSSGMMSWSPTVEINIVLRGFCKRMAILFSNTKP